MRRILLGLAIPVFATWAVGCTSCPHRARFDGLRAETAVGPCGVQRDNVVAVVVGPETVFDFARVHSLTQKLNEAGYARVYRAGPLHMAWLEREVKRTHAENPDAQFVLIGYALGGRTAHALASVLTRDGVPVDSLVLLDPFALDHSYALPESVNVTVVRSHGWTQGKLLHATEWNAPGVGHIDLPNHPDAVGTVLGVLSTVAARRPVRAEPEEFGPRPVHLGAEWDFVLGPAVQPTAHASTDPTPEPTARIVKK